MGVTWINLQNTEKKGVLGNSEREPWYDSTFTVEVSLKTCENWSRKQKNILNFDIMNLNGTDSNICKTVNFLIDF